MLVSESGVESHHAITYMQAILTDWWRICCVALFSLWMDYGLWILEGGKLSVVPHLSSTTPAGPTGICMTLWLAHNFMQLISTMSYPFGPSSTENRLKRTISGIMIHFCFLTTKSPSTPANDSWTMFNFCVDKCACIVAWRVHSLNYHRSLRSHLLCKLCHHHISLYTVWLLNTTTLTFIARHNYQTKGHGLRSLRISILLLPNTRASHVN